MTIGVPMREARVKILQGIQAELTGIRESYKYHGPPESWVETNRMVYDVDRLLQEERKHLPREEGSV